MAISDDGIGTPQSDFGSSVDPPFAEWVDVTYYVVVCTESDSGTLLVQICNKENVLTTNFNINRENTLFKLAL